MNQIVSIDYENLARVESVFCEQQRKAGHILVRLARCVETLEGGQWVGGSADQFYSVMHDDVLPACERLPRAFERAATTLAQAVSVYRAAEEEAAALFTGGGSSGALGTARHTAFTGQPITRTQTRLFSTRDGGFIGAPPQQAAIFYINGIQNPPASVKETVTHIEAITGQPVTGIYNATAGQLSSEQVVEEALDIGRAVLDPFNLGNPQRQASSALEIVTSSFNISKQLAGFASDVWQSGNDITDAAYNVRIDGDNPAVQQLVAQIKQRDGDITIIGHSQGAAIVSAALGDLEREGYQHLERITVTTLGGAGVTFADGPHYNHVVNEGDRVPGLSRLFSSAFDNGQAADAMNATTETSPLHSGHGMTSYYDDIQRLHGRQ